MTLKDWFLANCTAQLSIVAKHEDGSLETLHFEPAFDDEGKLAGLNFELSDPPLPQDEIDTAPNQNAAREVEAGEYPRAAQQTVGAGAASPGATEFDPVTGQQVPKASEQV